MNTKPKIKMTVIKEDTGYSAHDLVGNISLNTCGDTFEELKEMILDVVNLAFEDKGFAYAIEEIEFKYDLESFFHFWKETFHRPQTLAAQAFNSRQQNKWKVSFHF